MLLILLALIYFIPWMVAVGNKKRDRGAIVALNLFLGWTVIGWVIALVWAMTKDPVSVQVVQQRMDVTPPAASILCAHCGKYSYPGARFCATCGGDISTSAPDPARPLDRV